MKDALITTCEITKLIKFSPQSWKANLPNMTPSIKLLCPTRWGLPGQSNWQVFLPIMKHYSVHGKNLLKLQKDTKLKARIIGAP